MSDRTLYLTGLAGFVLSGVFFLIVGIRASDPWTIAGCAAWMLACAFWAIPLLRGED